MIHLSGFGDEVAADLDEQLKFFTSQGIRHLELRAAWGINVADLSDEDRKRVKDCSTAHGVKISALATPIGKIGILDPMEPHREKFRRLLETAAYLETDYLRIFSFYLPEGDPPAKHRSAVMDRMALLARDAEGSPCTLGLENEHRLYGQGAEEVRDVLATINSPKLRCVFDPANFAVEGIKPYDEAWPVLRDFILYFHVKDYKKGVGCVPAGDGDGQWEQIIHEAKAMNFSGFFSLEPHLEEAGASSGFSGPENFARAIKALRDILGRAGFTWG